MKLHFYSTFQHKRNTICFGCNAETKAESVNRLSLKEKESDGYKKTDTHTCRDKKKHSRSLMMIIANSTGIAI